MSTTTVKTIGTSSRDYSTLQAWEDAKAANLTTSIAGGEIWQGQCYNDAEFSAAVTISGSTTDATGYAELTAASGQSFADNANKLTNALKYNQSNGVGVTSSTYAVAVILINEGFARVSKIQVKPVSPAAYGVRVQGAGANTLLKQLIVDGDAGTYNIELGGSSAVKIVNSISIVRNAGAIPGIRAFYFSGAFSILNCTIVKPSDDGANGNGIALDAANVTVKNTAVYGFAAFSGGSGSFTSSDYNSTDQGTASGGAHDQTSKTYANQFQTVTDAARDFRGKASADIDNAGITDSANTGDIDIVGTTREASPTIGAWEIVSGAGDTLMAQACF